MATHRTKHRKVPARPEDVELNNPAWYINRELSWLAFNWRVLEEALDERHPLLERVKFFAIFASNLDEFFMIRVSGLRRQAAAGAFQVPPDGMLPSEALTAIRRTLLEQLKRYETCWSDDLLPKLQAADIHVRNYAELPAGTTTLPCAAILNEKFSRCSPRWLLIRRIRFRTFPISV